MSLGGSDSFNPSLSLSLSFYDVMTALFSSSLSAVAAAAVRDVARFRETLLRDFN